MCIRDRTITAYAQGPYRLRKGVDVLKNDLKASFHANDMIKMNDATNIPTREVSVWTLTSGTIL